MYDLGTSTMRLELGNLSLNIERWVNKVKDAWQWPHWTVPNDCDHHLSLSVNRLVVTVFIHIEGLGGDSKIQTSFIS